MAVKFLSIPFLIAAGITVITAFLLARWLGGLSIVIAACLWAIVGLGVLHAAGHWPWIDRQPALSNLLQVYAPRSTAASTPGPTFAGRTSTHSKSAETRPLPPNASKLVGIEQQREEINQLVQNKAVFKNTVANATVIFLSGPSGTGKTSMAWKMAADLRTTGIVQTDQIVTISETVLSGLGDSYGASADTLSALDEQVQRALDGILFIDDFDRLLLMGDQVTRELGPRILKLANGYPRRLLVICTGSDKGYALVKDQGWMNKLKLVQIPFVKLPDDALERIFLNLLASGGFQLAPNARNALRLRLREIRTEGGEQFDNAYAVMRLTDASLHNQAFRLRRTPSPGPEQEAVISADDVRQAMLSA